MTTRPRCTPASAVAASLAALALLATAARAADADTTPAPQPPLPLWEIGGVAVGVSQQAYPGAATQLTRGLALPFVIYRGRVLRADRDGAALRALHTETFELDVGVAGSFGSRRGEIEARRGMAELGTLIEVGPRAKWKLGAAPFGGRWQAEWPVRAVLDLSDGLARRGLTTEPRLLWERRLGGGTTQALSAGALFGDRRLAETLYGVTTAEARADPPAYTARAGLVAWRLGASMSTPLDHDWRVFGALRVDSVGGAANTASPLVRRTVGASAAVGVLYTWKRSERPAVD